MSSQRGNVKKKGPPKHRNKTAFKNTLHDKSKKTQELNDMVLSGLCARCRDIIDWKIKYKKYKPLTTAKKCVKCEQKAVKQAYYIMCAPCASAASVCAKCGKAEAVPDEEPNLTEAEKNAQHSQMTQKLKMLSERERRTYFRHVESGKKEPKTRKTDPGDESDSSEDEDEDDMEENGFPDEENSANAMSQSATSLAKMKLTNITTEGDTTVTEKETSNPQNDV